MNIPPEHKTLIGTDRFTPLCNQPPGWSKEDWAKLRKFGLWYEALIEGSIAPVTRAQEDFVAYFRGPQSREPNGEHESLWATYLDRLKYVNQDASAFGAAPRIPKPPRSQTPRLENGDDDAVYFNPKRPRR